MPEIPDILNSPQAEFAKLTKPQRLAAFLIILGHEGAAQILRKLDPPDVEAVTSEMTRMPMITMELQREVLKEFTTLAMQATTAACGGVEYTQQALEKSFGAARASDLLSRVVPHRPPVAAMQMILELEPRPLANLLRQEQPQTIALIVSYLSPEKASHVLASLPENMRGLVVERLATLAPTPVDVVERVAAILQQKLGGTRPTRAPSQSGGIKTAADVMNALDRELSKGILQTMEERNPELAQTIKNKMFTFEDMVRLDTAALQKVLREVDLRDLALALKNASDGLRTKMLSSISKRAGETVKEEIAFMGAVKNRELEASKLKIVEIVRNLEAEGEIDLAEVQSSARHEAVA